MVFSELTFLYIFLPICLLLHLSLKNTAAKNAVLLVMSLLFYAWGEPVYIFLLIFLIIVNYFLGLLLATSKNASRIILAAGIVANLSVLGYYKYFNFILHILNRLSGRWLFELHHISNPIGISFFTFSAIAYLVDLYRGHYGAEKNPVDMALYLSFFPKVSVGPIVRYQYFGEQMKKRTVTMQKTAEGIRRFSYGLGKRY